MSLPNGAAVTRHTPFEQLPEFLSIEELAAYLDIGRTLSYELVRRGEVANVRFGRIIRIPKSALARDGAK